MEEVGGRAQAQRPPVDQLGAHAPREAGEVRQRRRGVFVRSASHYCRSWRGGCCRERGAAPSAVQVRVVGCYAAGRQGAGRGEREVSLDAT
jgi:hypothetical protein